MYPAANPNLRRRLLLVGGAIFLLLIFVTPFLFRAKPTSQTGKVVLSYNVQDTQGVAVRIDGTLEQPSGTPPGFILPPGSHKLIVTKPGYVDFSATVTLRAGQTTTQQVTLKPLSSTPNTTNAPTDLPIISIPDYTITGATYFHERTWAVLAGKTADGNNGTAVVQYSPQSGGWQLILQPGAPFEVTDLEGIPDDVQQFLINNGFVSPSD